MSSIRGFSALFISHRKRNVFSIYTRILLLLALFIEIVVSMTLFRESNILFTVYANSIVFALLFMVGGAEKVLNALKLPMLFILIGFATTLFSMAMGYPTPSINSMMLSTAKLTALFLTIALFFQWISLRELRWIMNRVGAATCGGLVVATLALIPALINNYSDAFTSTLLKLGRRRVYKALKPLVIHAAMLSRDIAQALYLYGIPSPSRIESYRPRLKEIILSIAIIVLGIALQLTAP